MKSLNRKELATLNQRLPALPGKKRDMIQARELRIGNFIFDDEGLFSKVIGFTPFDHSSRCDEDEGCEILIDIYMPDTVLKERIVESKLASPIPLTPEWLERCGFEFLPFDKGVSLFDYFKKSDNFELFILHKGVKCEYQPGVFYYKDENHPIKYLHQLQNLYFTLTGEELQIATTKKENL